MQLPMFKKKMLLPSCSYRGGGMRFIQNVLIYYTTRYHSPEDDSLDTEVET